MPHLYPSNWGSVAAVIVTEVLRKRFVVNHNAAGQIKLTAAESYFSILNWGCYAASMCSPSKVHASLLLLLLSAAADSDDADDECITHECTHHQ